jgi:ATP-dependent DNA helicase RecG
MGATPIPRTLALILMGDLDISNVDELPPGRQKVDTLLVGEEHRERLNGFISKQVAEGRQVYIVCPSVEIKTDDGEEVSGNDIISFDFSDTDEPLPMIKSAVQYEQELRTKIFPNLKTAFIHGKMKGKEKDAIMKSFADGEIDILVSTTVIEVGVNVPNATLMIVENAERFGLSQLHQLRGRVGRGKHKSYCVLVSDATGANAKSRLEIMRSTSDGYAIAQKDLELRGPGDFIASSEGARQHGGGGFRLAGFCADSLLLDKVFKIANETVNNDSQLTDSEKERVISYANKQNGVGVLGLN